MIVYQVFHSNDSASENFAAIGIDAETPEEINSTPLPYLDPELPVDLTHCHIKTLGPSHFSVSCYQCGQQIQCCGHGLLACAHMLLDLSTDSRISLGPGVFAERSGASGDAVETWLHLPSIESTDIEPPTWTDQLFSPDVDACNFPLVAAVTSNTDGYLLLQLPDSTRLSKLEVNIDAIIKNTGRAILLWQRSNIEENLVGMRYFAPQYGKTGGEMLVINKGDCVAISGNAQLVKNTESSDLRETIASL